MAKNLAGTSDLNDGLFFGIKSRGPHKIQSSKLLKSQRVQCTVLGQIFAAESRCFKANKYQRMNFWRSLTSLNGGEFLTQNLLLPLRSHPVIVNFRSREA